MDELLNLDTYVSIPRIDLIEMGKHIFRCENPIKRN